MVNGFYLACASKKGISAHQIHRLLEVTYKTAWFMMHRIRYVMAHPEFKGMLKGTVEVDKTDIGGKRRGADNKMIVVSLVKRKGNVRSWPVERVTSDTLKWCIRKSVDREAR